MQTNKHEVESIFIWDSFAHTENRLFIIGSIRLNKKFLFDNYVQLWNKQKNRCEVDQRRCSISSFSGVNFHGWARSTGF